jgi:hypothetical protein
MESQQKNYNRSKSFRNSVIQNTQKVVPRAKREVIFMNRQNPNDPKKSEQKRNSIFEYDESFLINLFTTIFKKHRRNQHDNKQIMDYLSKMGEFLDMLRDVQDVPLSELIQTISMHILYEFAPCNSIILKTGDSGDKFYIILKGRVDIMAPRLKKIALTDCEYFTHLFALRRYNEIDLLCKTIFMNRHIYPLECDDFNKFLVWVSKFNLSIHKHNPNMLKYKSQFTQSLVNLLCSREVQALVKDLLEHQSHIKNEKVLSSQEYINRVMPKVDPDDDEYSRRLVSVYEYHYVLNLSSGNKFGETALNEVNAKRNATVISTEDTHLGVISKHIYQTCIKSVIERIHASNIELLLNCDLFRDISYFAFSRKYFSNFVSNKFGKGEKLLVQGEKSDCFYFVREGQYEVYLKISIFDLTELIKKLGGTLNDFEERHACSRNISFNKLYKQKQKIKICIIDGFDLVGFYDQCIDDRNMFTVELLNHKGSAFKLDKAFYESMCESETSVPKNSEKYVKTRKDTILTRLCEIREVSILAMNNRIVSQNVSSDRENNIGSNNTSDNNLISKGMIKSNTESIFKHSQEGFNINKTKNSHRNSQVDDNLKLLKSIEVEDNIFKILNTNDNKLVNNNNNRITELTEHDEKYKALITLTKTSKNSLKSPILAEFFSKEKTKKPASILGLRKDPQERTPSASKRCSSAYSTKRDLSEDNESKKRDYFLRTKYRIRNVSTLEYNNNTSRNSSMSSHITYTPKINNYYYTIDHDDRSNNLNESKTGLANKINALFHNKAKLFEKQFIFQKVKILNSTGSKKLQKPKINHINKGIILNKVNL